jgi:hypothetical protein
MKRFNNTLAGTDCGDAGLPPHWRDTAKAKTVLRLVPRTPDMAIKAGSDGLLASSPPASSPLASSPAAPAPLLGLHQDSARPIETLARRLKLLSQHG